MARCGPALAVCRVHRIRGVQTLRDIYKKDLTEIIVEETVEDGALYKEVQTYLETEMPDELPLLRAYTDPSYPLVKCYNLEGAIREARQERVWMKSGAYLVIQQPRR